MNGPISVWSWKVNISKILTHTSETRIEDLQWVKKKPGMCLCSNLRLKKQSDRLVRPATPPNCVRTFSCALLQRGMKEEHHPACKERCFRPLKTQVAKLVPGNGVREHTSPTSVLPITTTWQHSVTLDSCWVNLLSDMALHRLLSLLLSTNRNESCNNAAFQKILLAGSPLRVFAIRREAWEDRSKSFQRAGV